MNNDFFYNKDEVFFDGETLKKIGIIFVAGCLTGVLLAVMFAGFFYGIQPKINNGQIDASMIRKDNGQILYSKEMIFEKKLSYGKLFIIIIAPCILLGLIAGILLL